MLAITVIPLLVFIGWITILPTATVHYSKDGKEELKYIWNVQHRIYKGDMFRPGSAISDNGFLFPDENFFMEVDWWGKSIRHHCVSITPKWPNTHIYLDANGEIDSSEGSGTNMDRLKPCRGGTFDP